MLIKEIIENLDIIKIQLFSAKDNTKKKKKKTTQNDPWGHFISVQSQSWPTLWPHGLQHARPPCPSLTPRVNSNSSRLSQWRHPTTSSSVVPYSSHPQSFPASGTFQTSQFFPSGGQNIGVSPSTSVLPMNTQDWFPWGWTSWISW